MEPTAHDEDGVGGRSNLITCWQRWRNGKVIRIVEVLTDDALGDGELEPLGGLGGIGASTAGAPRLVGIRDHICFCCGDGHNHMARVTGVRMFEVECRGVTREDDLAAF
eukprot:scaffold24523_cov46-Cyclotella_meneghiniana.AAC.3